MPRPLCPRFVDPPSRKKGNRPGRTFQLDRCRNRSKDSVEKFAEGSAARSTKFLPDQPGLGADARNFQPISTRPRVRNRAPASRPDRPRESLGESRRKPGSRQRATASTAIANFTSNRLIIAGDRCGKPANRARHPTSGRNARSFRCCRDVRIIGSRGSLRARPRRCDSTSEPVTISPAEILSKIIGNDRSEPFPGPSCDAIPGLIVSRQVPCGCRVSRARITRIGRARYHCRGPLNLPEIPASRRPFEDIARPLSLLSCSSLGRDAQLPPRPSLLSPCPSLRSII